MSERPILFSAPMVRVILAGTKCQTRRIVKPQPEFRAIEQVGHMLGFKKRRGDGFWLWPNAHDRIVTECPFGQVGDELWVRETFSGPWCMEADKDRGCAAAPPSKWGRGSRIWYWADGEPTYGDWTRPRPSIFMPRWASRITLEITDVRVERLQDISEADAIAEGIKPSVGGMWTGADGQAGTTPKAAYALLWQSINGPESWAANPFVWVVEFKRVEQR